MKELKHKIPEIVELQEILSIEQSNKESIIHKLSHQHLHTKFWMINTRDIAENGIPLQSLENYPVPVLIGDFIETFKNSYF